jgi:hypothetical protein
VPRRFKILALFALLVASVNIFARSEGEVERDMERAISNVITTYKKEGMNGLVAKTSNCYAKTKKANQQWYCVYFDFASRAFDIGMVDSLNRQGANLAYNKYYSNELISSRCTTVYIAQNIPLDKAIEHQNGMIQMINELLAKQLAK